MGNKYLADIIQDATGITGRAANEAAEAVIDAIFTTLKKEGRLSLMGFGTFQVIRRPARLGRNPATGESIKIKASKSVRFKPSRLLKSSV